MCQMSMKLPAMFDQNPTQTFDKIRKKLIRTKTLSELDLGHSRNQTLMTWGTNSTCHPKKNLRRGSLSNCCDADADSSKTICRPHPTGEGGRYNDY